MSVGMRMRSIANEGGKRGRYPWVYHQGVRMGLFATGVISALCVLSLLVACHSVALHLALDRILSAYRSFELPTIHLCPGHASPVSREESSANHTHPPLPSKSTSAGARSTNTNTNTNTNPARFAHRHCRTTHCPGWISCS